MPQKKGAQTKSLMRWRITLISYKANKCKLKYVFATVNKGPDFGIR